MTATQNSAAENLVIMEVNDLRTYFFYCTSTVKAVAEISFNLRQGETLGIVAADRNVDCLWASSGTCNDSQARFLEIVRRKLEEVDRQEADLEYLKQNLQRLESHLGGPSSANLANR